MCAKSYIRICAIIAQWMLLKTDAKFKRIVAHMQALNISGYGASAPGIQAARREYRVRLRASEDLSNPLRSGSPLPVSAARLD
jgi:hypothetical protein